MKGWARRVRELHDEITAITEPDWRWWLLAGGAAITEPWGYGSSYIRSDAGPGEDTFLAARIASSGDPISDAIEAARAARAAIRELDGSLPDQPLAVTIARRAQPSGVELVASSLDHAAFAIGDHRVVARLDDPQLFDQLRGLAAGRHAAVPTTDRPFVCVTLGDEPLATARHGHRRAWTDHGGPWLGIGRCGQFTTVSTCHLVVDGYGHARIAKRIFECGRARSQPPPPLAAIRSVDGAIPLGVAWRELAAPVPHTLRLAYATGEVLRRHAAPGGRFSPTFQVPISPGDRSDPARLKRRSVPGILSVRFEGERPEPFAAFQQRARERLQREARGEGLCSRLLAAARGAPAPLAWKRRGISATRPRWLDPISNVLGGRACLSKIFVDPPLPATIAVSSPARMATADDDLGGCVITLIHDGGHAAITLCGSGKLGGTPATAAALLDELVARYQATTAYSLQPR